jgi:hypothetical protein
MRKEIAERARRLHVEVRASDNELTIPTGLVFLMKERDGPDDAGYLTQSDQWRIYATWHEAVHVMQLATTPCLFAFGIRCASMAMQALDADARAEDLCERRADYCAELDRHRARRAGGWSVSEIAETHAVVQGTMWALGSRDGGEVASFVKKLYSTAPPCSEYVRLLDHVAGRFGPAGVEFLPRGCVVALNAEDPSTEINQILAKFEADASVALASPLELCGRLGVDPSWLARSLRERSVGSKLAEHPYVRLFHPYFDAFEARDRGGRLDILLMGPSDMWKIFMPTRIYEDGDVRLFRHVEREDVADDLKSVLIDVASDFVAGEGRLLR